MFLQSGTVLSRKIPCNMTLTFSLADNRLNFGSNKDISLNILDLCWANSGQEIKKCSVVSCLVHAHLSVLPRPMENPCAAKKDLPILKCVCKELEYFEIPLLKCFCFVGFNLLFRPILKSLKSHFRILGSSALYNLVM